MKIMLINAKRENETRIALVNNQKLYDIDIEAPSSYNRLKDNLYNAKITNIKPDLDAVFVDYGGEKHGFLPIDNIRPEYLNTQKTDTNTVDENSDTNTNEKTENKKEPLAPKYESKANKLYIGQNLLVQIKKDQIGNNKGAALTTYISLAGSYLVAMPNNPKSGISKYAELNDRTLIKDKLAKLVLPDNMGIILRTAGIDRNIEELQLDLDTLTTQWQAILQASEDNPTPYLIHVESDAVLRAVRDHLREDMEQIVTDNEDVFNKIKKYITTMKPEFTDKIYYHDNKVPLFTHYQIEEQIETIFKREITLPSGGTIVFDKTEALTAIDINSAKSNTGKNIEDTALKTNLEAIHEIVRQIRLRDSSGIIVIDLIDMHPKSHRDEVEKTFSKLLVNDRAKIKCEPISNLTGCMSLLRQRLGSPFYEANLQPCTSCRTVALGKTRTIESFANYIIHKIEENSITHDSNSGLQIQLPLDVVTYMLNELRDTIKSIETQYNTQISLIPNPSFTSHKFILKHVKNTSRRNTSNEKSYDILKTAQDNYSPPENIDQKKLMPAVKSSIHAQPSVKHDDAKKHSLILKLWQKLTTHTHATDTPKPPAINKSHTTKRKFTTISGQRKPNEKRSTDENKTNPNQSGNRRRRSSSDFNRTRRGTGTGTGNNRSRAQRPANKPTEINS